MLGREIRNLVRFARKLFAVRIAEDEVENRESRLDLRDRVVAVRTKPLGVRRFVDTAGAEREDLPLSCDPNAATLALCNQLVPKAAAAVVPRPP